jgi:hypothetical protein
MQLHYNRVSSNHVYAHYFEKKFHVVLLSERKNIFTFFFFFFGFSSQSRDVYIYATENYSGNSNSLGAFL